MKLVFWSRPKRVKSNIVVYCYIYELTPKNRNSHSGKLNYELVAIKNSNTVVLVNSII